MAIIRTEARVGFDYDTEDGLVSSADEAMQDTMEILPTLDPSDFEVGLRVDEQVDAFYEAVENIVVSYQDERISAERAMSAIAAAMADIVETDGSDV